MLYRIPSRIALFSFMAALLIVRQAAAQYSERQSLGLEGCYTSDIRYSPDGKNLFISCEAPKGVFWSTDNGNNWEFAKGGGYESGSVKGVAVTQYGAVFGVRGKLFGVQFGEDGSFTPEWRTLAQDNIPREPLVTQSGKFVILGSEKLAIVDSQTMTVVSDNIPIPLGPNEQLYLLEAGPSSVFVIVRGADLYANRLYRASFNNSTGTMGAFQDITTRPGFPADSYFWNLRVHPSTGKIFVDCRNTHVDPWVDAVYVSTDNAESFTALTSLSAVPVRQSFNDACFSSDPSTYLIGTSLTTDDGNSFSDANTDQIMQTDGGQEGACVIDPTNVNRAFARTAVGVARTENLTATGAQVWARANRGLDGVSVYHMTKGETHPNRVLLASSAGYGFSDTFNSDAPAWTFPMCANGDCGIFETCRNVVIDPDNEDILFAGGWDVHKGTITGGTVTWNQFIARTNTTPGSGIGTLYKSKFMPGILAVGWKWGNGGESPVGGALNFFNSNSGELLWSGMEQPVSSLIALSPSLMFAGVGSSFDSKPTAQSRGIARSTDGGHTWTKMGDPVLDSMLFVREFAYDSANDILYAAGTRTGSSEGGGMYLLSGALKGATSWAKASTKVQSEEPKPAGDGGPQPEMPQVQADSFEAVSVDAKTGNVYGATSNIILISPDRGQTWIRFFEGMDGESMKVVETEDDGTQEPKAAGIPSKVVQGSNVGINALTVAGDYPSCTLTVALNCKKAVKSGTKCKITSTLFDIFSHTGYSKRAVKIQKSANGRGKWKNVKAAKTNQQGVLALTETIKATAYYRALATSPACTSPSVRINMRKKGK